MSSTEEEIINIEEIIVENKDTGFVAETYGPYAEKEELRMFRVQNEIMLSPTIYAGRIDAHFFQMLQKVIDRFIKGLSQYRFSALIPLKLAFYQEPQDIAMRHSLPFSVYSELKTLIIPEIISDYKRMSTRSALRFYITSTRGKLFLAKAMLDGYGLSTSRLVQYHLGLDAKQIEFVKCLVIKKRFQSNTLELSKDKVFDDTLINMEWLHETWEEGKPSDRLNIRWKKQPRPKSGPSKIVEKIVKLPKTPKQFLEPFSIDLEHQIVNVMLQPTSIKIKTKKKKNDKFLERNWTIPTQF